MKNIFSKQNFFIFLNLISLLTIIGIVIICSQNIASYEAKWSNSALYMLSEIEQEVITAELPKDLKNKVQVSILETAELDRLLAKFAKNLGIPPLSENSQILRLCIANKLLQDNPALINTLENDLQTTFPASQFNEVNTLKLYRWLKRLSVLTYLVLIILTLKLMYYTYLVKSAFQIYQNKWRSFIYFTAFYLIIAVFTTFINGLIYFYVLRNTPISISGNGQLLTIYLTALYIYSVIVIEMKLWIKDRSKHYVE